MKAHRAFPSLTLAIAATAALLHLAGAGHMGLPDLLYSRSALEHGELWRLVTGHLVHFSWKHLAADMGSFLFLGIPLERTQGRRTLTRLLLLLALGTGAALWWFVPQMELYGGISALNYGLLTRLCLTQRGVVRKCWEWLPLSLPVLLLAHVGWQSATETSLLSAGLAEGVRVAWQAHLAAVVLACLGVAVSEGLRTWRRHPAFAVAP